MTPGQIVALLVGSAVISGIISSVINGLFNVGLKRVETRESRFAVAAELTRLNQERYLEPGRDSPGSEVSLLDPATVMRFYIAELDAMADNRSALKAEWNEKVSYRGATTK